MSDDFIPFPEDEDEELQPRPRAFVPAGRVADIPAGKVASVWVKNQRVAVFNVGGRLMAVRDRCTHMGSLLSDGRVSGTSVVCGWHGWTFDLESGRCLNKDWAGVEAYGVRIVGDRYEIEVPVD